MNAAKYLMIISLAFLFACSSDEDDGIAGVWFLSSLDLDCQAEPELTQSLNSTNGCYTLEGEETCIRFTFDDAGSGSLDFTIDGNGELLDFLYTMNASETEVEICTNNECSTLVIRGEKLLLIDRLEGCDAEFSFEKQ